MYCYKLQAIFGFFCQAHKSQLFQLKTTMTMTAFQQLNTPLLVINRYEHTKKRECYARTYLWRPYNWNSIWYSIKSARVKQCKYACFHSLQLPEEYSISKNRDSPIVLFGWNWAYYKVYEGYSKWYGIFKWTFLWKKFFLKF